jgi:hypothetical protein
MMMGGMLLAVLVILVFIGILAYLSGHIWLMVRAFQKSTVWGLLVLFLSPLANIVFAIKYWTLARAPFLLSAAGVVLIMLPSLGLLVFRARGGGEAHVVTEEVQVVQPAAVAGGDEAGIPPSDRERVADMLQGAGIDPDNPASFKGRTIEQMTQALGPPSATMKLGTESTYIFYNCFEVVSKDNGKTVSAVHYIAK